MTCISKIMVILSHIQGNAEQEVSTMPGRFALQPMLHKIWHAPDNIRILDPLPLMHRRGIIIGFCW